MKYVAIIIITLLILSGCSLNQKSTNTNDSNEKVTGASIIEGNSIISSANLKKYLKKDEQVEPSQEDPKDITTSTVIKEQYTVSGNLILSDYSIDLKQTDIDIIFQDITVLADDMTINLKFETSLHITNFDGTLVWDSEKITIAGALAEYLADIVTINWKDEKNIHLEVNKGKVLISKANLEVFDPITSGNIKFENKLDISLENDQIHLDKYTGSIDSTAGSFHSVTLNGLVNDFYVETGDFGVFINK